VILCFSVLVLEGKSTLCLSVICVQFIQKLLISNACDWIIPVMFVQITITCLTTRSSKRETDRGVQLDSEVDSSFGERDQGSEDDGLDDLDTLSLAVMGS
jgi:hypothetical protein